MKGKVIKSLVLANDAILMELEGGKTFWIWDDGQLCCEDRYITTDDDLSYFSGSILMDIVLTEAPDGPSGDDQDHAVHEIQFLTIKTSKGIVTFETHDEHNGAYGRFAVRVSSEEPAIVKWRRDEGP